MCARRESGASGEEDGRMKVLQINIFGNLSTGKIAVDLYKTLAANGHEGKIAFARGEIEEGIPYVKIGNKLDVIVHVAMTRLTDKAGFYSKHATKKLIKVIEAYDPDIIHLHNIHGYYINIELLFDYLKGSNKPIVWTLHDCWAFTGHCCYFDFIGCQKWQTKCFDCPQINTYPASYRDNSRSNYAKKKELFTSIDNLTIVTPSQWLAGLVKQSFLHKYTVKVIPNGIDLSVFKPSADRYFDKEKINDKKIILCVASIWTERKGLKDIIELSKMLSDEYKIVVVGKLNGQSITQSMIHIDRTNNQEELAKLYSQAYIFVNPTYEDNFPTVNIEALACGTPVITYKTGGSPEVIDESCGLVTKKRNAESILESIKIIEQLNITVNACVAIAKNFDKELRFKQYIDIYNEEQK